MRMEGRCVMGMLEMLDEKDLQEQVLEGLPCSPREDPDICWDEWVIDACITLKIKLLGRDPCFGCLFANKELVRSAVNIEMMNGGVVQEERMRLCELWDRRLVGECLLR